MNASRQRLGLKIRTLRDKAGLTLREVSEELQKLGLEKGFSPTHLSNVEKGQVWPAHELVRGLEDVLNARGRLVPLLRDAKVPPASSHDLLGIDLHVFFVGRIEGGQASSLVVPSEHDEDCDVHLFPFGVAVAHYVERLSVPSLTAAALHRCRILKLSESILEKNLGSATPSSKLVDDLPYGLSLFVLHEPLWSELPEITRAVHLLAAPSLLVQTIDMDEEECEEVNLDVEESLMGTDDPIPDLARFDVAGSHVGAATWSAVSIYPHKRESPFVEALLQFEVQLQALWCYASYCERGGQMPGSNDVALLRSSLNQLAASNPREHISMRLLRDALVTTSRIDQVVARAIDRIESQTNRRKAIS